MNKIKGNKIENWDISYKNQEVTYSEELNTPADLFNHLQYQFVYEDINKYLSGNKKRKVLECGCGGARTSLFLAQRGFDVTCSDYASEALLLAQRNFAAMGAKGAFIQDDLLNSKLPSGAFDCVMSFGLLEHFEDIDILIKNITRLVKPGGIQIHCVIPKKFSTQTIMYSLLFPFKLFRNIFIRRDFRDLIRKSYRDFPHFENEFSAREYCSAFSRAGNEVIKCEPGAILLPFVALPFGLGRTLVRNFSGFLSKLIRRVDRTESSILHLMAPTFYVVCRKNSDG